jgi:phosphodiester glycosidase
VLRVDRIDTVRAVRVGLALALALAGAVAAPAAAELPLGPASSSERRATTRVAPGVRWTRIVRSGGPWRVHVVTVDPGRRVSAVLSGGQVHGVQRTSTMARRRRAPVAVNGGYFNVTGEPVGVLATGGRLVSEPVGERSALLLARAGGAPPRIAGLRWAGSVEAAGRTRLLDGVDRTRGRIPACGGVGGDLPFQRPNPFVTCRDASELVLFSPAFGARTGTNGSGWEAVIRGGRVTALRRGGNSAIPPDGVVLSGSGDAAAFLRDAARTGSRPRIRALLRAGTETVDPAAFEAIAGGGPRLLRAGRVEVAAAAEGFDRADERSRQPRTLAGIDTRGRLLLVTVDGRRPGWSAGVTMAEAAAVMRSLGARDAMSFDSGGSTTMVIRGRVVNRPSDGRERGVSDAVLVRP